MDFYYLEFEPNSRSLFFFDDLWLLSSFSNPPKMTRLSRNLIALLSYGGVPNDFFLNILRKTLEESKTIFYSERAAIKGTKNPNLSGSFAISYYP